MYYTPYICHHGVKGQKWGVRRKLKSAASKAKTWAKNNKSLLVSTAYVAGAAFVYTLVSSAVGSIPVPVYRSSHSEEYRQGLEAIRGLNLMAQGYVYSDGKYYKLPE